jgi:hypothetical protein
MDANQQKYYAGYVICWRSLITGATGKGSVVFTEEQARDICDELNKENAGTLTHWKEQQPAQRGEGEE